MADKPQNTPAEAEKIPSNQSGTSEPPSAKMAYRMVMTMLGILCFLILAVLLLVYTTSGGNADNVVEFGKWTVSVLLGAFGAWIGGGAAYFFGKENMVESNRSTEAVLQIQQNTLQNTGKRDYVKDLPLSTINSTFNFNPHSTKEDIVNCLTGHADYWWVPVFDQEGKGIIEDILHVRIIWDDQFDNGETVAALLEHLADDEELGRKYDKLHGSSFFIKVTPDDKVADTARRMEKSGAAIGVVTDEKGKPTHCFTKHNLLTTQS
jgi:uncharacterized integral membrane protein